MKRKQFLAFILTGALIAGSNMTAAAAVRMPAIRDSASAQGVMAEDGESGESSDKALEQAMTDAIGQVSTGAAKEETVYVFTDAYGKQRDITVSNWLKNPEKKSTIEDQSSLNDIENVKGDETFEQKGDKIVRCVDPAVDIHRDILYFVVFKVVRHYLCPLGISCLTAMCCQSNNIFS